MQSNKKALKAGFRVFFDHFWSSSPNRIFPKNLALSQTISHGSLTPCWLSKKAKFQFRVLTSEQKKTNERIDRRSGPKSIQLQPRVQWKRICKGEILVSLYTYLFDLGERKTENKNSSQKLHIKPLDWENVTNYQCHLTNCLVVVFVTWKNWCYLSTYDQCYIKCSGICNTHYSRKKK